MTRTSKEIAVELFQAEAELTRASNLAGRLRKELEAARVGEASDPWLGKTVSRLCTYGYRGKTRTERGTVIAYIPNEHRNIRGFRYWNVSAGDPIVMAASGKSAWPLKKYDGTVDGFEIVE